MTLLIGIEGAVHSGKTTLATRLRDMLEVKGYRVELIPEVATELITLFNLKPDINGSKSVLGFQYNILYNQISSENQSKEKKADLVLVDRTILGNAYFFLIRCGKYLQEELAKRYAELFHGTMCSKRYDGIIYCKPVVPVKRQAHHLEKPSEIETEQRIFDLMVEPVIRNLSTPYIIVRGGVEKRLDLAIGFVEKLLQRPKGRGF